MEKSKISAIVLTIIIISVIITTGSEFKSMQEEIAIYPSDGLTEKKQLSDYFEGLKDTPGDTEVYVFEGEEEGGSTLILGGTHPNEPASNLTTIMLVENLQVDKGRVFVITESNKSAFTHNDPQEGSPHGYHIETNSGERYFKYGSRATNPIHQWPDPDVYIHSSGQKLSGSETRNLNRAYPGRKDGTLTEKIAFGITNLINEEKIDVTIDLHEASPEYPVINALVTHEKSSDIASMTIIELQFQGIQMSLEASPKNLHGLSHRELGDFTDTYAMLMETANPSQGRLRGATTEKLIVEGKDKIYEKAGEAGFLFVEFDENGHPISERVARHTTGINEMINSFNMFNMGNEIIVKGIPDYEDILKNGIGSYLQ